MAKRRRQLRNYLVNRNVQLKFTAIIVVLAALLTTGLGYFWYSEVRKSSEVLRLNAMSTLGEEGTKQLEEDLGARDRVRLLLLVGFAVLFAALIGIYGIIVTHKLAGPLYKISRHINDIENNRLYELWDLRKGDQLQEFFASFKAMHGALRERAEADMLVLNRLITAIERGDVPTEELPRLKELLKEKGDSLRNASEVTQQIKRADLVQGESSG
jgi:methyl-accepting chemotaxis protein